jgi:ABC-type multidrug transport system fused ATPase/permease subunit
MIDRQNELQQNILFLLYFKYIEVGCIFVTGIKLQSLMGHLEFVNVSFHYPSRPTVNLIKLSLDS